MTALTRLAADQERIIANQERLEKHMITIVQTLTEERAANDSRFPPSSVGIEPDAAGAAGIAGERGGTRAPLALGDELEGYGATGPDCLISGYIDKSLL